MAAKDLDSDLDFAFELQMQEAMDASLRLQPSSSSSSSVPLPPLLKSNPLPEEVDFSQFAIIRGLELGRLEQERRDRELSEAYMRRMSEDLKRRVHDQKFAQEILQVPEDEWKEYGDTFEKAIDVGYSTHVNHQSFRLYFKGLVSDERVKGSTVKLSGIGAAVCDPRDNLVLRVQKPLMGDESNRTVEAKALIEGLTAALSLDIKRIVFYCDNFPLYQNVIGRWPVKQRKIATLVNQIVFLIREFESCRPILVPRNDIKFAFRLARDAIDSQITKSLQPSCGMNLNETCEICLEDTDVGQMFAVNGCLHRYCSFCMKQHIEVKLLHGMVPECPHEACKTKLNVDTCKKLLSPKLLEIMSQRMKEESIPVTDKVYCPYPRCSALMSKSEASEYAKDIFIGADRTGVRKCVKCRGLFCINCIVPWHSNLSCHEYKSLNPHPHGVDAKLKSLATQNLWRQCVKCNHMIELAEGCFHMTCRCGYEFCYTCGSEWKNKKATCSCPIWQEDYILHGERDLVYDEEEEEENDYGEVYDAVMVDYW